MENVLNETTRLIGAYIPSLLGALAVLVIGWLAARVISNLIYKLLHKTDFNSRMARWSSGEEKKEAVDAERAVSRGAFYMVMLFVLVGFFQTLGITQVTEPINRLLNSVFQYAPLLIGAGVLAVAAFVVASLLRMIVSRGLSATNIDKRLGSKMGGEEEKSVPLTKPISDTVYWLTILLFLPAILSTLGLEGILRPVQNMLDKILAFLPNLVTAAVIMAAGWFIAKIVQQIVTNLLAAVGSDRLSDKVGISTVLGKQKLSGVIGLIVNVLILIPIAVAALNALELEAVTLPASNMLNMILGAIPNIFAAALVVAIGYVVGRIASGLISNLLAGIGFNVLLARIGLSREAVEEKRTPSAVAGYLVLAGIVFFSVIEASRLLGFQTLAALLADFMVFAGHIIVGLMIFGVGVYIANLVYGIIRDSGAAQATLFAVSARIGILVLAGAMALRQMGFANEIINLAFGLTLGAVAVALAISFGIGGRELAARKLDEWVQSVKTWSKSKAA